MVTVRSAVATDAENIRTLVHSERLNPSGLDWHNFIVATDDDGLVGAVQMRPHLDGSRELGSLVVRKDARGTGVGAKLIDTLLAREKGRVQMITAKSYARHYERWGFRPIEPWFAPKMVRRNYQIGQFAAGVLSLFLGRRPRRLVILDRASPA